MPKQKICHKELRESRRWLRLIQRAPLLKPARVPALVDETEELVRMFAASLRTASRRKPGLGGQKLRTTDEDEREAEPAFSDRRLAKGEENGIQSRAERESLTVRWPHTVVQRRELD